MREISKEALKKKVHVSNPHWESGHVDELYRGYRPRRYFDLLFPLIADKSVNRAVVLMGPRRVGKTVILYQVIENLLQSGEESSSLLYLSLDTPLLQGLSLEDLVQLYLEIFPEKKLSGCIVIFDEIQYLKDWDVQLKVLVDNHPSTRWVASGSAAAALKRKSRESGAGRFTDFMLPPLTFYEYLDLLKKKEDLFEEADTAEVPVPKNIEKLNVEFINYLNFGGFPEAIFNESIQKSPERYLRSDIIDKVLLRDLPSLYGIQDVQELNRLFGALAYQTGNEITYGSLSQQSGVVKNTIKRYIEYLEAAFLIKTVRRIDDSGKKFQRDNYFKVYLTNPSLYSALFELINIEDDATTGNLVETAIFSQWLHRSEAIDRIHYARWSGGKGEIDIVFLDAKSKIDWCVEVKWSDRYIDRPFELKKLIQFCSEHELKQALVTTRSRRVAATISSNFQINFLEAAVYCFIVGRNSIRKKGDAEITIPAP